MITPQIVENVNQNPNWTFAITNGGTVNPNVYVNLNLPTGLTLAFVNVLNGTVDTSTGVWNIGQLEPGQTVKFLGTLQLGAPISVNETYSWEPEVFGLDTNPDNNKFTESFQFILDTCDTPFGGSIPGMSSCLCVDVSTGSTPCTVGATEYRLDLTSIVNGTNDYWDVTTGTGGFTPIDPTLPITFNFSQWCGTDGANPIEVSCSVPYEIKPQLADKKIFNHTLSFVKAEDLSIQDITILQGLHPTKTIEDYCWELLRNSDGEITGGLPHVCEDVNVDNRYTIQVVTGTYSASDSSAVNFPTDPQEGDIRNVYYDDFIVWYEYTATGWIVSDTVALPGDTIDWANITNVPADLLDGDDDTISSPHPTLSLNINGNTLELLSNGSVVDTETLPSSGGTTIDWSNITNIPADILDGDDDTISSAHPTLTLGLSGNDLQLFSNGTLVDTQTLPTTSTGSVDWSAITNIPADILDGDDDTISTPHPKITLNVNGNELEVLSDGALSDAVTLPSSGGGLTTVATDTTISGDGTAGSPLSVVATPQEKRIALNVVMHGIIDNNAQTQLETLLRSADIIKTTSMSGYILTEIGIRTTNAISITMRSISTNQTVLTNPGDASFSSATYTTLTGIAASENNDPQGYTLSINNSGTFPGPTRVSVTYYFEKP